MAEHVLSGGLILFDGLDLSNSLNQIVLDHSADSLDSTAIGHTTRRRIGGLRDVALGAAGFFEAAEPDASLFAAAGVIDKVVQVAAAQVAGSIAYFMRAMAGEYQPFGGSVGDLAGFRLAAGCSSERLVRGTLLEFNTRTTTANGAGLQLGQVAAGKRVYAGLNIVAVSGGTPSLTVKVQSDDNAGFSSPTDRIVFNAATGVGSQFLSAAGPITDDYWRIVWTISGTTPSFKFAASVGIQ